VTALPHEETNVAIEAVDVVSVAFETNGIAAAP